MTRHLITESYVVGLVRLRHRLVAERTRENLERIERVRAATVAPARRPRSGEDGDADGAAPLSA